MVHTFQATWNLDDSHLRFMKEKHNINFKEVTNLVKNRFKSMKVNISEEKYNNRWMSLIVDVPILLKRGEITDGDYDEVENVIKEMLSYIFGDDEMFDKHYLARFDYRLDKKVENKEVRDLYNDLYKKTCRKNGRMHKKTGKKEENGKFNKYETSMYHSQKTVHTILYDKEAERHDKGEIVEKWEEDIMRFEVRLLKDNLKNRSKKSRVHPIKRNIKSYFKQEIADECIQNYLVKPYIMGDFYTFENAEKMVDTTNLVNLTPTMKKRMKDFLKRVSTYDLTVPKSEMSPSTFRSRLKCFGEMNMHPVTIPQTKTHIASFLPCLLTS